MSENDKGVEEVKAACSSCEMKVGGWVIICMARRRCSGGDGEIDRYTPGMSLRGVYIVHILIHVLTNAPRYKHFLGIITNRFEGLVVVGIRTNDPVR